MSTKSIDDLTQDLYDDANLHAHPPTAAFALLRAAVRTLRHYRMVSPTDGASLKFNLRDALDREFRERCWDQEPMPENNDYDDLAAWRGRLVPQEKP